jgi:hypothetical protein
MKRFHDEDGTAWDAVVGRASWGVFHLLFIPVDEGPIRQVPLEATSADEAERMLAGEDQSALVRLLGRSRPRDP